MQPDRVLFQVWVPRDLAERADAAADLHGLTRPELVRRALADAAAKLEGQKPALPATPAQ